MQPMGLTSLQLLPPSPPGRWLHTFSEYHGHSRRGAAACQRPSPTPGATRRQRRQRGSGPRRALRPVPLLLGRELMRADEIPGGSRPPIAAPAAVQSGMKQGAGCVPAGRSEHRHWPLAGGVATAV
jgi:hypothetical protein